AQVRLRVASTALDFRDVLARRVPALHDVHPRVIIQPLRNPAPVGGPAKRIMDVAIASAALLFLAPFLLAIAAAVRLESTGPAIFMQRRGGFGGRTFLIWKFRTMRVMDDGGAMEQARKGDPRVTRLGAFLRRSSLDELPQLVNVLKGEMSLVG